MNTDYAMQAEIDIWTPKLTLLEFACNDYHDGTVVSTYKSQLQTLISRAQQFGDCLLIASGTYTDSPSSASIPYRQAMLDLAIQNNCAYLDIIGRWGEDGLYAKETLDFIDDTIHPNNAGHRDYATAIANVLLETL
jgi:lysophospholipase L1-like esterase